VTQDFVPPAIQLLLNEDLGKLSDLATFRRRVRRLLPELRRQSRWTLQHFRYLEHSQVGSSLVASAAGHLDPLGGVGLCGAPECRVIAAHNMAQTLGLYADIVALADSLSIEFADARKLADQHVFWLATQVLVLRVLQPLLEAGVVRFWSGGLALCEAHFSELTGIVDTRLEALIAELGDDVGAEIRGDTLVVSTGKLYDLPIYKYVQITKGIRERIESGASVHEVARDVYRHDATLAIRETLFQMHFAGQMSAPLFSTSRGPKRAHRYRHSGRGCEVRYFRRRGDPNAVRKVIDQLRLEASQLEADLSALDVGRGERFRNLIGGLGLTVSVYGFASGLVSGAVAAGGLLTLLQYIHSSTRKDKQEVAKAQASPAFVLVKAKELLEHASHRDGAHT
jgi:hypothetical protein